MKQNSLLPKTHDGIVDDGPVECLGMTFASDSARREHFLAKLAEKLQDPEFRKISGFPKGSDEAILHLSDPPYYTACPNPWLREYVECYGSEFNSDKPYLCEPFSVDVQQGKGGKIYKAHTYHTKVPHEAIARYILHYTEPGDLVLDAFAGCGMTGVAASFCGAPSIEFKTAVESSQEQVSWGARHTVLVDLSPFATFISGNMCFPWQSSEFVSEAYKLVDEVRRELPSDIYGNPEASYIIWSQTLVCPECSAAFAFGDVAISASGSISSRFQCPICDTSLSKAKCDNKIRTFFDELLGQSASQNEYQPILVVRSGDSELDSLAESDWASLAQAADLPLTDVPVIPMMFKGLNWGDMFRAGYHYGISHIHHFWTKRNLAVLSAMWRKSSEMDHPNQMRFVLTSFMVKTGSRMHNVGMKARKINLAGQIFNTLQIPSLFAERNLFDLAKNKIDDLRSVFDLAKERENSIVSTGTAAAIDLPSNCIDYVFVDPPFGSNIKYSEMSFLYEAWLGVYSNSVDDTIVSKSQSKNLEWYRDQMRRCFSEIFRVLKPSRWLTVAFHNSRNDVWSALQEALQNSGFVVADVRILDKGQGTYKQMTTSGAVEKDLAISAYKPSESLEERFDLEAGTAEGAWEFVRVHLSQLALPQLKQGVLEVNQERMRHLLFDRMVAFYVQRRATVPLSASEFYLELTQRFPIRDGMYFLPEQVSEYDKQRLMVNEVLQMELFVSDEASAIQWLKQVLDKTPQSFRELHPRFLREIGGWHKHEQQLELSDLLAQNFLRYDGAGEVPSQIHTYLSSNFKNLRNLSKGDAALRAKAKDRWYVPDPRKAGDLEQVRERALLREFDNYQNSDQKRLTLFRLEAVRVGFVKAWKERDYKTIISVAKKIPQAIIEADPQLMMMRDNAITREGSEG